MSDLPPTSPSTPGPASSELTELREQCAQLRTQTFNLRIAQLVVALALAGFFWVEVRRNGQALQTLRPQAAQVDEVAKKQSDAINEILNRLAEFGRTHPDFVPILNKYRFAASPTSAAPGSTPAAPKK
jgi:hypothetical protein